MKEKIQKAKELEKMSLELAKEIINDILGRLSKPIEMEGVRRISHSPNCVSVPLSQIMNNKFNLSAEYYISEGQLSKIRARIQNMTTVSQVKQFIDESLTNGYITGRAGETKYKLSLNPAVTAELQNIAEALA